MIEKVKKFKEECEAKGIDADTMRRKIEERVRYLAANEPDDFWSLAKAITPAMHIKIKRRKSKKK